MGKMSLLLLVLLLLYLRLQTHAAECRYRPSMKMLLYRLDMCYAKRFLKMSIVLMIVFEIISAVHDICTKLNESQCYYDYDDEGIEQEYEEEYDQEELCV